MNFSFPSFYSSDQKPDRDTKLLSFYKKKVDRNRKRILIACMPKSGSTFLTQALMHYLRFPTYSLARAHGRSEQEICWENLAPTVRSHALFIHQHVRANEDTLKIIRLFNIRTIVLIRNLLDVVVSLRDHILKESSVFPMAYVDDHFLEWEIRRQHEFVIDLIMPWYLNFLGTWIEAKEHEDVPMLWLNYSDWITAPASTLQRIDDFCGLKHPDESAAQAVAKAKTMPIRLNVGISGRGEQLLDDELKAKVLHLVSYYPSFEPYIDQLIGENTKACE